jgi:TetR/AcrR family transcriptional regulator, transcriptional repressor for nem operon
MNQTKEHILQSAFMLFLQKSFKEVTMKELVTKTGVSKGAFYHYFPSKETLFNEIIDTYYITFFAIDYNRFDQENLYNFYHQYLDYIEEGIQELSERVGGINAMLSINYFLLIFDAIRIYPGFREKEIALVTKEQESWEKIIRNARSNGEIKTHMTDKQVVKIFTTTNDGISLHVIMEGRINYLKDDMLDLWDAFYEGIKA